MGLVEPDVLLRSRMPRDGLTNLRRAQSSVGLPGKFDLRFTTKIFDGGAVVCLKYFLPRKVQRVTVVSDVSNILFFEAIANRRFNARQDFAAVGNRGLAALRGRLQAKEPQHHGPMTRVRHLVVQGNCLVGRVFRRREDLSADLGARRRTIGIVEQVAGQNGHELFKVSDSTGAETAKKKRAMPR